MATKPKRKTLNTPVFRASFPAVFKALAFEEGDPLKYSVCMIFDKKKADLAAIEAEIQRVGHEKFGAKLPSNFRSPIRDGSEKADLGGFGDGVVFMNASTKQRPGVVDRNRQVVVDEDTIYAGCYLRAQISFYAYDTKGNKGVGVGLHHVQFVGDGERIDGRVAAEDAFEDDIEEDAEAPWSQDDDDI